MTENEDVSTDLSVFLAGIVAHLGEVRVPIEVFELNDKGIEIIYDEDSDELIFRLDYDEPIS